MYQKSGDMGLVWAVATATASGATSLTLTLPGGAVGTPKIARASGTVGAQVTVQISNSQQIVFLVNPNAPADEKAIPKQASPGKQNQLSATATLSAAGNVYVSVGFQL